MSVVHGAVTSQMSSAGGRVRVTLAQRRAQRVHTVAGRRGQQSGDVFSGRHIGEGTGTVQFHGFAHGGGPERGRGRAPVAGLEPNRSGTGGTGRPTASLSTL